MPFAGGAAARIFATVASIDGWNSPGSATRNSPAATTPSRNAIKPAASDAAAGAIVYSAGIRSDIAPKPPSLDPPGALWYTGPNLSRPLRPALCLLATSLAASLFTGCDSPAPVPKEEPKKEDSCPLAVDTLAGTSWLWLRPQPSGPDKPQPQTRMRFRDDGGKIKADYTASSLSEVYTYSCEIKGKIATCIEDDVHAKEWSRAWAATHEGKVDPAGLSAVTGIPAAEFERVQKDIEKEVSYLKGEERTQTFVSYNGPNNKIRGKFMVAVDKAKCMLTVQDKYIAMQDSRVVEYENPVGTAKFQETKEGWLFEACKDVEAATTVVADGATAHTYPAGTYEFTSTLHKDEKPSAQCTYSANVWKDWLPLTPNLAPEDPKAVKWSLKVPLSEKGPHVVSFERFKTCGGGAQEKAGISCAKIHIE